MLSTYISLNKRVLVHCKYGFQVNKHYFSSSTQDTAWKRLILKKNDMDSLKSRREQTYARRLSAFAEFAGRKQQSDGVFSRKYENTEIRRTDKKDPLRSVNHRLLSVKSNEALKMPSNICISTKEGLPATLLKNNIQQTLPMLSNAVKSFLRPSKTRQQLRLLVTTTDNKLDIKETNTNTENKSFELPIDDVSTILHKNASEYQQVDVKTISEVRHIFQKFPMPKSVLHNFYQVLAEELKDKSLKVEPIYKAVKQKNGSTSWTCNYHIKWPVNAKVISNNQLTKKEASSVAAAKAIDLLSSQGRISPAGLPLVYTSKEVKQLNKKEQTEISFDPSTIKNMQNIIQIFNDKMSSKIESVDFNDYRVDHTNDVFGEEPGSVNLFMNKPPQFLGTHKYLAREKVDLPISAYK